MKKKHLTDEEVEREIEKLVCDPMVALARKEERIRYRRRQYLYQLRSFYKKGKELAASGITMEVLDALDRRCDE